jgi:exodeoxyribonuclease-1
MLEVIEEPIVLYCKITSDYLPDIEACLLTGITPQDTLSKGLCEYEFIKKVNQVFSVPGTCVLGYNNIRFDDEFVRNALYRNFLDPYKREWADRNSRWDLIDMVRLTHDLRPGNIVWPKNPEGHPSFKLEDLSKANQLTIDASHDALVDVKNTIALARLIYESNPRLFEYCFAHRDKHAVSKLIDLKEKSILVHTSRMLASEYGCTSLVVPMLMHPDRNNYVLSYDLRYDPESLIKLSTEDVERLIFVGKDDPDYEKRIHIKGIQFNKCPILAPSKVLDDESYSRLHISREVCQKHYDKLLKAQKEIVTKLTTIYSKEPPVQTLSDDPDEQIYSGGFFSDSDRDQFALLHKVKPTALPTLDTKDKRVPEMLFRWVGRNYPEVLSEADKKKWNVFQNKQRDAVLAKRNMTLETYQNRINELLKAEPSKKKLLTDLLSFSKP